MSRAGIVLDDVAIDLAGARLFGPVSLQVPPGSIATIMGASGSGKSTLLSAICGMLDPVFQLRGRVLLDSKDLEGVPPESRQVGILFQDDLLFPHMSVGDNLAFGIPAKLPRQERQTRINDALEAADLAGFADRAPATLSGGQRARVACLRALLAEPKALLLDEPFSKLDASLRDRFRHFVFDLARSKGLPVLLVTHDPDDAAATGGPVIRIDG